MKRLKPLPAPVLEFHSRRRKPRIVRKSARRSKSAVQRTSPVMPASGGFKERDYPKGEQELHQDEEGAGLADVVEQDRRDARGQGQGIDGQNRAAPGHAQRRQAVGEMV